MRVAERVTSLVCRRKIGNIMFCRFAGRICPDEYRLVGKSTQWEFGGAKNVDLSPRVIDMLAYGTGKYTQEAMLKSFDVNGQNLAVIYPVPLEGGRFRVVSFVLGAFVLLILIGLVLYRIYRFKRAA